jgi:hypothetical protein
MFWEKGSGELTPISDNGDPGRYSIQNRATFIHSRGLQPSLFIVIFLNRGRDRSQHCLGSAKIRIVPLGN